jgi:tyrosyl-tRNA synthetase
VSAPKRRVPAPVRVETVNPAPVRTANPGTQRGWQSSIGLMTDSPGEAARFLTRNAVDALPQGELERQLGGDRPLRVKLGVDPTTPDIHLGHTVVLRKLREFQDLGHTVVLIVGDYTARVGDPSGRSSTRPQADSDEIDRNARTYEEQAFKVLNREQTEVRRNGEWLDMPMEDLFRLARTSTVAQLLERDDFHTRYAGGEPISILELLYPLMQGYDSVAIRSDVELGGTDQKFNILLAREIQKAYGVEPQSILTMPILPGIDGVQKMSKSLGNYVGVDEPPEEMFGKLMRVPDDAMPLYYNLLLDEEPQADPREAKRHMAFQLAERYHGTDAAGAARERFDTLHIRRELPEEIEEFGFNAENGQVHLPALLADAFGLSRSEARRLLSQGGVKLDGKEFDALDAPAEELDGVVLQVGKRRFKKLRRS